MDPRTFFKPNVFMGRLNKYTVNSYYLDLLKRKGNLRDTLIKTRIKSSRETIEEMFTDPQMWKEGISNEQKQKNLNNIILGLDKKEAEEVDNFFITHLNQTLVMLCTVFDTYLVDCFGVITFVKPGLLNSFTNDKDISVKEVIDSKNYENIFSLIQNKVLKRFDFAGIEDKFRYFAKAGISKETLFTLNSIMSSKYPDAYNDLLNVYSDRNDIVHRNVMKITTYEEISRISELMIHLIMHWGTLEFRKQFTIDSDIILMYQGKIDAAEYYKAQGASES